MTGRHPLAALLVGALLGTAVLAGCASSPPAMTPSNAHDVLAAVAENLGTIRSGVLTTRLVVGGTDGDAGDSGFELAGPFALPAAEGTLPLARLEFTEIVGRERVPYLFLSTGDAAFVEVDGQAYRLPADSVEGLRGGAGGDGLEELRVDRWIRDAELHRDGDVDRVEAAVDVAAVLEDLLTFAAGVGADNLPGVRTLSEAGADQLRRAVRSSHLVVEAGRDDHLLRSVEIRIEFGADGELPPGLVDTRFAFRLMLDDHNRDVDVDAPRNARELDGLPLGG